jgi:hypothetical protein
VPPHKVAHLLRATFSNIEQQGLEFVRDALTPWAERLRQEADRKLRPVNKRLMHTRLDLEWLAEGDSKTKAEADSLLVNSGIMNRNEVRRRRGLNTIPDGDKHTVQLAMTTLDKIGEEPDPPPDDGAIEAPPDDGTAPDDPPPDDDDDARAGLRVVE